VFALTAAAGIALSISDHSHRLISYIAWYGAAGVAFVVAAVTTVIIDQRETRSERKARRQRGRRRLWPWGHPEVGKIHEQDLHNWLAAVDQSVGRGEACGYGAFPNGASQHQRAIAAHFSDLTPKLVEWDQALARRATALDAAREQIKRAVLAATIPAGYDRNKVAEIIARFIVGGVKNYKIALRASPDVPGDTRWHVYLADGLGGEAKLTIWPEEPIEQIKQRSSADEAALQAAVESARHADRLPEIHSARTALEALKQPLQDLLNLKRAVSPIVLAKDCPYCQAQLQGRSLTDEQA